MKPTPISDYTLTTCLGTGRNNTWQQIVAMQSGLAPCDFFDASNLATWTGTVSGIDTVAMPTGLEEFDCRNNRLALLALEQDRFLASTGKLLARYGADRVGIFIGTSTSGIHQTERAYLSAGADADIMPDWYNYQKTHNVFSIADFVAKVTGSQGPVIAISTACSSSAKVFASAHRAIMLGLCDAAIVGGVDSLCLTTLYGFHSLQLLSDEICRPNDPDRKGLSIGEAAGFAILDPAADSPLALLGYGESSDAYHMSSPHPDGDGAAMAMRQALARAGVQATAIDYINLHGTGTPANDLAEARAIQQVFPASTACSSTKGWTGHTLGAAGIVESALCLASMQHQLMPANLNRRSPDPAINIHILAEHKKELPSLVMTNSFGFGGSNCSLVFGCNQA